MRLILAFILIVLGLTVSLPAYARTDIPFEGIVDLGKERLTLRFGDGGTAEVMMELHRSSADSLAFLLDLRHVSLPFCDLATVVQGDIRFTGSGPLHQEAEGEIRSQYTLINHKPVRDPYLKFAVRNQKFIIEQFWAGAFSGSGEIDLSGEHRSNLSIEVVSTDLERVSGLFWNSSSVRMPEISGILTGAVTLSGPLVQPLVKGHVAAYNGCFKALCYESIQLQLDGTFPNIRLDDSAVTHADGFNFNIAGSVDLSDLAQLPSQIRQLRKVPVVSSTQDKREWILKRQRSETNKNSVTEMKYLWLKDDRGDAEGVLGFEQKIGF